jgi:hypothetical protein
MRKVAVWVVVGLVCASCSGDRGGGGADAAGPRPDSGAPDDADASAADAASGIFDAGGPDAQQIETVEGVCLSLCGVLVACSGGGDEDGCRAACEDDLTGCTSDELDALAACASAPCDEIWEGCIALVGCVGYDPVCGDAMCEAGECAECGEDCPGGCCPHDACTEGPPLDPSCGECVASVCDADVFCCTEWWDPTCVEAAAACATCGCGDGICGAGECDDCPLDCPEGCGTCADGTPAFGVDGFGYHGCASELGPVPPCEDISATGTLGCGDDDCDTPVDLPFAFDFYGLERTSVSFISNGKLGFPGTDDYANMCSVEPDTIAAYWDDLYPPLGALRYQVFGVAPDRHVTFQWNVPHYDGGEAYDIRAVLHEGSNDIEICYVDTVTLSSSTDEGASATVGIAGPAGEQVDYSCYEPLVPSGLLIRYEHPTAGAAPVSPLRVEKTARPRRSRPRWLP